MKTHFAKCLNCDTILVDENPQTDAKLIEVKDGEFEYMQWVNEEADGTGFWACPNCQTDGHLIDVTDQNQIIN